jgi:nucleotide-binding universal stress UspA family protein
MQAKDVLMDYKTIVVHLDCGKRRSERLQLSVAIAEKFDAYLIGVFALEVLRIPPYAAAEAGPVIMGIEQKRRTEAEQAAKREFQEKVAGRTGKAEWREFAWGDAVASVTFSARCADLLVIGQLDPDNYEADGLPPYFTEDVVLSAGKPVLVVPYAGHFPQVGDHPLVAWNGAREASRALADALPLLTRSETVDVVWFDRPKMPVLETDEVARRDVSRYLERHRVNAKVSQSVYEDLDVGDAIVSEASTQLADSIVMGAYGHSRLRERVLGGATRKVLDTMTVPVLMSH